jgi:hypothetical protein
VAKLSKSLVNLDQVYLSLFCPKSPALTLLNKSTSKFPDKNFFQLNRLWYTYIVPGIELRENYGGKCEGCSFYQDIPFKMPGHCEGRMTKCKMAVEMIIVAKVVNDNKRYMSGYSPRKNDWYGEVDGPGTKVTVIC